MNPWDQFTGANAGYVQELYERYQQDPGSVDEATRQAFAAWAPPAEPALVPTAGTGPPAPTRVPRWRRSSSPNPSAASATWPRDSIPWASTNRSAIPRSIRQPTA